jgi:ankyrin repeat protein
VNSKKEDEWQDTPLHYAAARSHVRESPEAALAVLRVFTAFGADLAATNFHGATPADLADKSGAHEAATYLRQVLTHRQKWCWGCACPHALSATLGDG